MEARLSRMLLHLLKADTVNSRAMVFLLSPGRNALKICTVVTRFEMAGADSSLVQQGEEMSTRMLFKAVLDIKVFGEVTTIEVCAPVTIVGRFGNEKLGQNADVMTSVDVKFDCCALLRDMIAQARVIVKKTVTDAAALSVKILSISGNTNAGSSGGGSVKNEASIAGNAASATSAAANQGNAGLAANDSAGLLAAALKMGTAQGSANQAAPSDTSGLLTAALKIGQHSLSSNDSAGMLAAALKLGTQQAQGSSSATSTAPQAAAKSAAALNIGMNSLTSNDSAGMLAAALKLGTQQGQGLSSAASAAPQASLTQLSSILNSASTNQLGANPTSTLSFSTFFGSLGNHRNDTFASLLKSSNSLTNLGASADWGLGRGDSAAILRRHLQNVSVSRSNGSGSSGGNANATFDFGTISGAGSAQARNNNLLLGLAGGEGNTTGGERNNSVAAKISNGSIEAMKNVVRFQEPSPNSSSNHVSAAAQPRDGGALNPHMIEKLSTLLQRPPAAGAAQSNSHKSQYDLLREMLLNKASEGASQISQSAAAASTDPSTTTQPSISQQQQHDDSTKSNSPEVKGNIHKGLFSWLENDSMFLSEDKLKEQELIHKKKEKESRKAPMPLRFFSSVDDGGEDDNLEVMGQSLFGKKRKGGVQQQGGNKKR